MRRTTLLPRRLVLAVAFVVFLLAAGVAGFWRIEHESLIDALLTTVSAVSTVGYSPPRPLDTGGKILALVLILGGLIGIALAISTLTEYFMEGQLQGAWERRKMERAIERMSGHFIISGFGRVGQEVARQLHGARLPFVVLDINHETLALARERGYIFCEEDASHDEVLQRVGIDRARGLIACADSDVNNVYVTLTARTLNPQLFIVARASQASAVPKLTAAGASRVVSPYVMAGRRMAEIAVDPQVAEHLDLLFDGVSIGLNIQEVPIDQASSLSGRTVREVHNGELHGAFIVALDREGRRLQRVAGDTVLQPGDRLLVVASGSEERDLSTLD